MGETRKLGKKALLVLVCGLLALNFSTFLSVPIHKYLTLIPAARISLSPRISPESTLEHGDYSMILVYSLTKEKGWAFTIIAEVIVLLVPAPAPGWGFSIAYFWQ